MLSVPDCLFCRLVREGEYVHSAEGFVAEGVDVALGQHEQVHVGPRIDVANRDEPFGRVHVLAFPHEATEQAVRHRRHESPPP